MRPNYQQSIASSNEMFRQLGFPQTGAFCPLEKIDYFRTHKDNHWRDKCIYLPEETVTNMHMNSSMYASPSFM